MLNKDYILRLAERFGRELAIIIGLRERNQQEEALIYIDDLFLQTTGLTSHFINTLSEETLVKTFSPLGDLNVNSCLWTASLLKAEGEIYEEMGKANESYYRYHKALFLLLTVILAEPLDRESPFFQSVDELLEKVAEYELPVATQQKLFAYYEHIGKYDKAEDTLFELLDTAPVSQGFIDQGQEFYARLRQKSDADLAAGNFSREEVREGREQLQQRAE